MSLFPVPERHIVREMMDEPWKVAGEIPANLKEIRRLNAWFGAVDPLRTKLVRLLDGRSRASILDIATGSADIPVVLHRWGQENGIILDIVASDVSPLILDEARSLVGDRPIKLVEADARSLPWANESFDVAVCSLALHHFDESDAVRVLQEMWRICRLGVIVVDLYRSSTGYCATWLATHVLCHNRLTRADGPLSVLRAYRPQELMLLARSAGLPEIEVSKHPFFRQSLVAQKKPTYG